MTMMDSKVEQKRAYDTVHDSAQYGLNMSSVGAPFLFYPHEVLLCPSSKKWIELIKSMKIKGNVILDLGCSVGYWCLLVSHLGAKMVVGLDLSAEGLRKAKVILTNLRGRYECEFVLGDAENLPFKSDTFNGVLAHYLLEHLPNRKTTLKQVFEVLKPEGQFLLSMLNKRFKYTWQWVVKKLFRIQYYERLRRVGHCEDRYVCPEDLKREIADMGFTDINITLNGFFIQEIYDSEIFPLIVFRLAPFIRKVVARRNKSDALHLSGRKVPSSTSASLILSIARVAIIFNNKVLLPLIEVLTLPERILGKKLGYSTEFLLLAKV